MAIIQGTDPATLLALDAYPAARARFDRYCEEGCIKFVTFHPGYSYKDFVEGIRPQTTADNGSVQITSEHGDRDIQGKRLCASSTHAHLAKARLG